MAKYRKKPVVVEAQIARFDAVPEAVASMPFVSEGARYAYTGAGTIQVRTLEGWLCVDPGDWIVKGVRGEFYPVHPDIFAETYEPVEEK
jgi:hypothetical protein